MRQLPKVTRTLISVEASSGEIDRSLADVMAELLRDEEAEEVLYIDHNHLHMVGNVDTGAGAKF